MPFLFLKKVSLCCLIWLDKCYSRATVFLLSKSMFFAGDGTCEDHWNVHSASAGNPEVASIVFSKSVVSTLVFKEVLHSFSKVFFFSLALSQTSHQYIIDSFFLLKIMQATFPSFYCSNSFLPISYLQMLNLIDVQMHKSVLSDLLEAFQPREVSENVFSGIQHSPSPGTIEYLYLGASSFIEDALDMGIDSILFVAVYNVVKRYPL